MFYEVSKEVFEKLPNFVVGVVAVEGFDNSKEVPAIADMLEENAEAVRKYFEETGNKAKNDPFVVPYREALRALGINPNRYACAAEALMDRIAKGKGMPSINPAVDLGNAISLKYKLPIGAHDIGTFVRADGTGRGEEDTGLEVRPATPKDTFVPFGADENEFDNPEEGEVVYVSGNEVRTRRWTWRQSEVGKITENTTAVLYPIDGFSDLNLNEVKAAMEDFIDMVGKYFEADGKASIVSAGIVDKDNPRFEF
ncbi:MAG TPA: hypothetical protein GX736_06285 [Mogibacterium sp.]|nr:hypothetical protein [Mogibacterium sp.]